MGKKIEMFVRKHNKKTTCVGVCTKHTEQTVISKGVHPANGKPVGVCILYQTRVLCQDKVTDRQGGGLSPCLL